MGRLGIAVWLLLTGSSVLAEASQPELQPEMHPEVQAALSWQLPENPCMPPSVKGAERDVEEADGARRRFDVDSYEIGRFERQEKRWQNCVMDYKRGLLQEFGQLKDSARHGLTQTQANQILANMALIQSVIESPDGRVATSDHQPGK